MSFASMHYFWILILSFLILAGGFYLQNRKQIQMRNWINPEFWSILIPEFSKKRFQLKWVLTSIGLLLIVVSLLRPQWGEHEEIIDSKGMDILFVLDLSNSMQAEDVNPSRLQRAQTFIKKTLSLLPDDRAGTVGFAGRAFLAIPLTNDFGYVSEVVESLNPTAIAEQGTEIDEAIDVSIKAFERGGSDSHKTSRAIVLISDGEDYGKDPLKVAARVKEFGAGFFAFSVGTPEGAPIPVRNENGILQTYKKDRSGKTVISRTNSELLSKIASAAGGKFFELSNTDDAAYILSKQLASFHRDSTKEQRNVTKIERFQFFLAFGILFLILAFFTGYRKIVSSITTILTIIILSNSSAEAQTFGSYWKNRKGLQEFKDQKFEDSARTFESAKPDDLDNSILDFNQATSLARAKKEEDAIYHFEETTKKSLNEGDYNTAAKSLYNEGVLLKQTQNFEEAFHKLTNAIEMAKISNQPELELKARQALIKTNQEKQKQQQDKQDKKEGKSESKDQQKKPDNADDNEQKKQNQSKMDDGKREFKSGTLSKDVAESIMNDLSDREKQLYQRKMKERKPRESQNEKDW